MSSRRNARDEGLGLGSRCLSLDALRGVAALAVLIFHFPHFYSLQPMRPLAGERLFDGLLWPIYDYGWMAVDLFFQLSGFVFFWLYADAIAGRAIGARDFFSLRLFRLYPLHLAALLIVAVEQLAYGHWIGGSFVYTAQDGWHFLLNLVMANGLPFAGRESFNGPSWSLSVEMALYVLFFLMMRWSGAHLWRALGMVIAGLIVYKLDGALGRGVSSFYLGGVLFLLLRQHGMARFERIAVVLALGAVMASLALWQAGHLLPSLGERRLTFGVQLLLRFLVFPSIIAAALCLEGALASVWRQIVWLGDISYSIYLLHIPVQIALVLASAAFAPGYGWLVRGGGLATYLALVLVAGWCSFHGFEQPMRRYLRARFGTIRPLPEGDPVQAAVEPAPHHADSMVLDQV